MAERANIHVCVRSLVALSVSRAYRFFYLDLFLAQKSATCITLCKGRIRVVLPLLRIFSKQPAANVWYQPWIMLLQTRKTKRGIETKGNVQTTHSICIFIVMMRVYKEMVYPINLNNENQQRWRFQSRVSIFVMLIIWIYNSSGVLFKI